MLIALDLAFNHSSLIVINSVSSLFLLESVDHRGLRGCGTYCHIRNAKVVFKNIDEWRKAISGKEVKVKHLDKEDVSTFSELKENLCADYFKRYFEKLAKKGPVVLPQIPTGINKVVDTMERWCNDTNDSSDVKGLVVHSFNVSEYFRKLFYDQIEKEKLHRDLDIKYFSSIPLIIVYNPSESVILLIRTSSENKELKKEIEFCSYDTKMFMLLFGDEVKRSKVKVISLLVSNGIANEYLMCEHCKKSIVSMEIMESYELFQTLWHNRAEDFQITNTDNIDETKIIAASAKLIGCLAAAPYFDDLPTYTEVPNQQMKHLSIILTPAQKSILYSRDKHLVIQGPYGSGKSIIARKKLQMLSDELREIEKSEKVHFICFDSQSALLSEIAWRSNLITHGNKGGEKLSEIIKNILKVASKETVNLIVDEYDGESLDKEEAETLNRIFQEKFQNAVVFLLPQSMEKQRHVSINDKSEKEEKNMFHLLQTMKQVYVNLIMRNSVEINNLIWVTQNFLKQQETAYRHPGQANISKNSTSLNEKSEDNLAALVINAKSKETGKVKPIEFVKKSASQVKHEKQRKISLGDESSDDVKRQEQLSVGSFGLDEIFGLTGIPRACKGDKNKIVNKFRYIASKGIGHNINSCFPKLFEVDFDNTEGDFKKLFALHCIFKKLNIWNSNSNNKHVILHFDTSTEETPKLLTPIIEYREISSKVTNNYKDFKENKSKSILVCNYRLVRGLEHSNVTVIIDKDIYSVQHYLVEAMARCTSKLNIVVLEKSDAVSKIIAQWEDGLNGQQLLNQWKVQITEEEREVDYHENRNLNLITINRSSKNHEEIRKILDQHKNQNRIFDVTRMAEEFVQKR